MAPVEVEMSSGQAEVLLKVLLTLRQWSSEGPPRNPRAAAGALAAELEALSSESLDHEADKQALRESSETAIRQAEELAKEVSQLQGFVEELKAEKEKKKSELEAELASSEDRHAKDLKEIREQADRRLEESLAESAAKRAELEAEIKELKTLSMERETMLAADRDVGAQECLTKQRTESELLRIQAEADKAELQTLSRRVESLSSHLTSVLAPVSALCRTRPLSTYAASDGAIGKSALSIDGGEITVEDAGGRSRKFKIDRVLDGASQEDMFLTAAPWVEHASLGGTACVFAYGATGSGKTHSMLGGGVVGSPGLAHHALCRLIEGQGGGKVRMSMVEVYCEQIRDLLAPAEASGGQPTLQCSRRDAQGRMLLDCVQVQASKASEAEGTLLRGFANRVTEGTLCNQRSSRSHVVLTVQVLGGSGGRLVLVDLAGSENVQRSGADEGGKLLTEAKAINRSLSALADVVEATAKQQSFVPYRNSRLTMLLEEALTASKVLVMVHVSPLSRDTTDTAHSLQFASRVRAVDFGAQRLRQDQEDRARAAQQRSQQEARQLQGQLDHSKRELGEAQKALQELRSQQQSLSEQLRERQRELVREQELRSKAEESVRGLANNPSTSSANQGAQVLASRLPQPRASTLRSTGVTAQTSASRLRSPMREANSSFVSSSNQVQVQIDEVQHEQPKKPASENEPPESKNQSDSIFNSRMPLGDRTNSDISQSLEGKDVVKSLPLPSPSRATARRQLQEDATEAALAMSPPALSDANRGTSTDDGTSMGKTSITAAVAGADQAKTPASDKEHSPGRWHTYDGIQVRSCLRRTPSDFRRWQRQRQEFGLAAVSKKSKKVSFAEEESTAASPPRWYLDRLEAEQAAKQQEALRNLAGLAAIRSPTPPARRKPHEVSARENRENLSSNGHGRWR
eukprot:TRINITY_DN24253_c1_g1_i1.p1 TRINITY_DN24253_c1_g1~~TRINITY_DN24253_c1_g1_i1.p1  ORF type:complete len:919 (+),score=215.13 TRINITY_DN24253_c1_g1_i1:87-2843(+)